MLFNLLGDFLNIHRYCPLVPEFLRKSRVYISNPKALDGRGAIKLTENPGTRYCLIYFPYNSIYLDNIIKIPMG
jgi:hypothetical protein